MKAYHKKEFDSSQFINPDVLYDSAKNWLVESGVSADLIAESSLVHIPFYQFYYTYNGQQFTAMVEASSGMVYANVWPAKSEIPFRMLFGLSIFAFLAMSIFSLVIALAVDSGKTALLTGEMLNVFLYGAAAIPLVIIAYFVAKKV